MEENIYEQLLFPEEWRQRHRDALINAIKKDDFQNTVNRIASFIDFLSKDEIEDALIEFIRHSQDQS
jgi:hypothetical protein